MNIPKDIITSLASYLETEIQAGRRLVSLDVDAVASFLAIPDSAKRILKPTPHTPLARATDVLHAVQQPITALDKPASPQLKTIKEIAEAVASCECCERFGMRKQAIPGSGKSERPDILFVGDTPEPEDEASGQPFSGQAGELLTKMINAMGYDRDEVFITHIVKCRNPANRQPTHVEVTACPPWLSEQIRLIQPTCIVVLGDVALRGLENNPRLDVNNVHGIWRKFENIPVMPTFHPEHLLRFPAAKKHAWEDLKNVLTRLGRTRPKPITKKSPKT